MVLFPLAARLLKTFMLRSLLLCTIGMHVLSAKLMLEHSSKQENLRNIVSATTQRGITFTKRVYENHLGNRCLPTPHTYDR